MKKDGFTLIELLTVLIVMGLVVIISLPAVTMIMDRSEQKALEADVAIIHKEAIRKISEERGFDLTSINKNNMKEHLQVNGEIYDNVSIMYFNKKVFITLEKDGLTATNIKNENDLKLKVMYYKQEGWGNPYINEGVLYLEVVDNFVVMPEFPFGYGIWTFVYNEPGDDWYNGHTDLSSSNTTIHIDDLNTNKTIYLISTGEGSPIPLSQKTTLSITFYKYLNDTSNKEVYNVQTYHMHPDNMGFQLLNGLPGYNVWCITQNINFKSDVDDCNYGGWSKDYIYGLPYELNMNMPIYAFPKNVIQTIV